MSVRMKKPHTEEPVAIVVRGKKVKTFLISYKATAQLLTLLKKLQDEAIEEDDRETIPADEVFAELYEKYGKVGSTIRGCRARDGMTQAELAKKLGVYQGHVSAMEWGRRPVGKKMAHKLAEIFNTNYRLFL